MSLENQDPKGKPESPFGLSPSAYPPSVASKHAPVVVPPASTGPSPPAERLPVPTVEAQPPQATPPVAEPLEADPLEPVAARTRPKRIGMTVLLVVMAVMLPLAVVGGRSLLARRRAVRAATSAEIVSAPAVPSTNASSSAPTSASAPAPIADFANQAGGTPDASSLPTPPAPFDRLAARAALDALAPTLVDCKTSSRRSGHAKVAFAPDGTVSSAKMLWPLAGTHQGACVAGHLKEARVAPFKGSAPAFVYAFAIPR